MWETGEVLVDRQKHENVFGKVFCFPLNWFSPQNKDNDNDNRYIISVTFTLMLLCAEIKSPGI